MIINSITLENFKSHKHSHIELNRGISLILGSNGAGKSSIFEAISYSFFKDFNGTLDEIVRKPADENDIVKQMKVTVEFEINTNHYKLIRGRKTNAFAELHAIENGKPFKICDGDTLVTNEIKKRLGLEAKSFKNAVYIEQGEITDLIDKTPAEKKELIAKLLNIDSLETAQLELKQIIDKYDRQKSENDGKLSNKDSLEEIKKELKNKIAEKQSELDIIIPEYDNLKKDLNALSEDLQESDKNKNEYEKLKSQIFQQKKLLSNLEEQKKNNDQKLNEIGELEKNNVDLKKYVEKLPHLKDLKELESEKTTCLIRLENVNSTLEKIKTYKKSLEDNEKSYLEYYNITDELESLNSERKVLEEKVKNNQEINVKIDDKQGRKKDILTYIRNISNHASKIFNENFNNPEEVENKVLEETEKTEKSKKSLEENIKENDKTIFSKRSELKNIEKSLKDLENTKDTCPICQSNISHEKHVELSKQYTEDIRKIELKINELIEANNNHNAKLKDVNNYLENINEIDISKLKDQYTEFNNLIEEIKELEKSIPQVKEDAEALEKLDKSIDEKRIHQKEIESERNAYIVAKDNLEKIDIEEKEKDKKEIESNLQEIKDKCRSIISKYDIRDDLDKTLEFTEKKVEEYHRNEAIIESKENILNENKKVNDNIINESSNLRIIEEKINNLNYDEEDNKKLHETYTSQEDKVETIKTTITRCDVEIKKDEESLERNKKELEELEEVSREQKHLKDYIKLLTIIRELYSKDGVQKDLLDAARPEIQKYTMDIFNDFDFDYSELRIDSGYDISVVNKNEVLNSNMMSGGERIVIALALRLGIARVISKDRTELLLLDEPTIHLDAEKRERLIEIISSTEIVPQMIVVTHDDGMEALSNHIIKISKVNGISHVDNS
ncbi:MAG: hypothetical protein BZ135_06470 [Methanosphaera sp. rholeuAM6]|nr:MAG: hypothetical protein BZ135_06470 [Methanosphaera sp. rholeuAM6]